MGKQERGIFLPTTQIWDSTNIASLPGSPDELKQLIIKLYENMNLISEAINKKDTGIYDVNEYVCGQMYFPTTGGKQFRAVYRQTVDFGALPAAGTKTIAHGITFNNTCKSTRVYGSATNPGTGFIPLNYSSPVLADNIELWADNTNINIKVGKDRSAYTECTVVLEYVTT